MAAPHHDVAHLLALIEAARAEAHRLGAGLGGIPDRLGEAATEARALLARGGAADEGIRPEDLTTANDV